MFWYITKNTNNENITNETEVQIIDESKFVLFSSGYEYSIFFHFILVCIVFLLSKSSVSLFQDKNILKRL